LGLGLSQTSKASIFRYVHVTIFESCGDTQHHQIESISSLGIRVSKILSLGLGLGLLRGYSLRLELLYDRLELLLLRLGLFGVTRYVRMRDICSALSKSSHTICNQPFSQRPNLNNSEG
jgi:hypothetical protein